MTSRLRPHLALPAIAAGSVAAVALLAAILEVPLRDPDQVIGSRFWLVPVALGVFWVLDVLPRAWRRGGWRPLRLVGALVMVAYERWTVRRALLVLVALVSFYVTYLAYRNAKSFLPLARESNYDGLLLDLDHALLFGHDSGTLLHDLLGTGVSAHVLSVAYLAFLSFVPLSLGAALVWTRSLGAGLWYVSALSLNWVLGAASYYLLPALGPIYRTPSLFAGLPDTGVGDLQQALADQRLSFLFQPLASEEASSIAAFASLHVSIIFTAALIARLLGLRRVIQNALWIFLALTVLATLYLGWHYVVDDIAGVALGAAAVYMAAWATGYRIGTPEREGSPNADRSRAGEISREPATG